MFSGFLTENVFQHVYVVADCARLALDRTEVLFVYSFPKKTRGGGKLSKDTVWKNNEIIIQKYRLISILEWIKLTNIKNLTLKLSQNLAKVGKIQNSFRLVTSSRNKNRSRGLINTK